MTNQRETVHFCTFALSRPFNTRRERVQLPARPTYIGGMSNLETLPANTVTGTVTNASTTIARNADLYRVMVTGSAAQAQRARGQLLVEARPVIGAIISGLPVPAHLDLEDLVSEGVIIAAGVVNRWDPARGPWATFLWRRVAGALTRQLIQEAARATVSLNRPVTTETGPAEYGDTLHDMADAVDVQVETAVTLAAVPGALAGLDAGARNIVERRYGFAGRPPQTRSAVSVATGLSAKAVRVAETRALAQLRAHRAFAA